jgi:hypothetical protein
MVGRRKEIRDDCLLLGPNQIDAPNTATIDSRRKGQRTFWQNDGIGAIACLESNNSAAQTNRPRRGEPGA